MKNFLIYSIFSCFCLLPSDFVIKYTIKSNFDIFDIDNTGNIYTVNYNTVTKYNNTGKIIKEYSFPDYFQIDYIDISNPFKILLYSKNKNEIIFTDNNLSQISNNINLDDLGFYDVTAICFSESGGFWFCNKNQLIHFDSNNNIKTYDYIFKNNENPEKIINKKGMLFIKTSDNHFCMFNDIMKLSVDQKINENFDFQIINKKIIIHKKQNSSLDFYNFSFFLTKIILTPNINNVRNVKFFNETLYLLTDKEIIIGYFKTK